MPVVLRELMRHKSIETTLRFYVGKQAADIEATCRLAEQGIQQAANAESNQKVTNGVYGGMTQQRQSRFLRKKPHAPVAQLDRAADF